MPVMGGVEFAQLWRAHEAAQRPGSHLPMCALTANVLQEHVTECCKAGCAATAAAAVLHFC